ncbi:hypothetical protein NIES593_16250 [Hydrococcus rivularis NIES-593]|uniref:Membrane-anchored protein n=1 Tax=Hydrococcus rivularis NIES-593 TaxID=1921803 RepID=A0A1U7HCN6_9CYAN|nr:hypothetical protein [Hydrococcus rivularis]OKH21346.1 hypothetical protein NIES593_16250 [Hydrococcus rivularis NIES-593]
MSKLPAITAFFWIMKICATTLGETAGDLLSMTLNVGYAISSTILIGVFLATLVTQLVSKSYNPLLYWTVILSTSTAGTTMSDFMDRTLKLGYATGSMILVTLLLIMLAFWKFSVGSLSVTNIKTPKVEILYWTTILFSNTLGTALGDFLADTSGLGFVGGAMLISGLLALVLAAHYFTQFSPVILFWIAFVLTRPFGATFGDVLTKSHQKGGLGYGTIGSSLVLASILGVCILFTTLKQRRLLAARISNDERY